MRKLTIAVVAILFFLVPPSSAIETLPPQLSDAAFWKIITDSSEPGGTFLSENFLSNERGYQYVIPPLRRKILPGGVYMGVGPEQNFTYMAAFHPQIAFIVDIRRQNMIEHLLYKAIFEMAPDRAQFLSLLFSRKLPSGLAAASSVEDLFNAYTSAPFDLDLYQKNLQAVKDLLWKQHKFALTSEDEASLEHVYNAMARAGTSLGYSVSDPNLQRAASTRILDLFSGPPAAEGPASSDVTGFFPPGFVPRVPIGEVQIITDTFTPALPQSTAPPPRVTIGPFPTYTDLMTATDATGANWSYLASEANYNSVREMQQKNLIVPLVGDFAGPKAIRAVGQYLKDHDLTVSVFYLSNVEQYLTPTATLKSFYDNVATLPLNSSSSFIRSAQSTGVQPGIVQSMASPIQDVLDAVIDGRAKNSADILRMSQ